MDSLVARWGLRVAGILDRRSSHTMYSESFFGVVSSVSSFHSIPIWPISMCEYNTYIYAYNICNVYIWISINGSCRTKPKNTRRDDRVVADGILLNPGFAHLYEEFHGQVPFTAKGTCVDSSTVASAKRSQTCGHSHYHSWDPSGSKPQKHFELRNQFNHV